MTPRELKLTICYTFEFVTSNDYLKNLGTAEHSLLFSLYNVPNKLEVALKPLFIIIKEYQ